jgi:cytochrome P450
MGQAPLPPGPRGSFLGGNLPEFRRDRLAFMTRCSREFGGVVRLRLGPRRVFVLTDPGVIEEVLVTQAKNFTKHFALRMNPILLGNGLLTSEGDFWLRQRRLIQPAFMASRLATYAPAMVTAAERLIGRWAGGGERELMTEMKQLTLDVTAEALFGADVTGAASAVNAALRIAQDNFIARFNSLVPPPLWLPTPSALRFRRAVRNLDAIIYNFLRQRRESGSDRGDLLSILLRARDEDTGGRMTDKQVRDEAMTLFLAGHETTALALTWTWYLLSQHPEAEAKLLEEARQVLGDRRASAADVPHLTYAAQVVQESMRLYPPVYTFGREAIDDCILGGFHVPARTTLLMSNWVVHRDPRWFDRPEEFRPERWIDSKAPKFAYFPFGGGPRICIGNTFAMMEMVLVLATVAKDHRIRVREGQTVRPEPTFTLRPTPIQAVMERRGREGQTHIVEQASSLAPES